ncbi:uncharacterized protein [Henckelia pumila]
MGTGISKKTTPIKTRKSIRVSKRLAAQFSRRSEGPVDPEEDDAISVSNLPSVHVPTDEVSKPQSLVPPKDVSSTIHKAVSIDASDKIKAANILTEMPFMIPPLANVGLPEIVPASEKTSDTVNAPISLEDHASRRIQMCTLPIATMDLDFCFLQDVKNEPTPNTSSYPDTESIARATNIVSSLIHQDLFTLTDLQHQELLSAFQLLQCSPGFSASPLAWDSSKNARERDVNKFIEIGQSFDAVEEHLLQLKNDLAIHEARKAELLEEGESLRAQILAADDEICTKGTQLASQKTEYHRWKKALDESEAMQRECKLKWEELATAFG